MKKVIALALTLALAASLVACGGKEQTPETPDTAATYKTGVGAVISATPVDETEDKGASVQVNTTLVAASFDAEGKIVSATIDVAQQKAGFDKDGKLAGEVSLLTKNEKGADYGMAKVSEIGKEINEQHAALADWMVGKTVEEVKAMKTFERDEKHTAVPDEEDLKASVTITVGDYIAALEKAYANAKETTGVVAKTGLGTVISAKTTDEAADKGASAQINTTFVVVALDAEGKVVSATLDVAQQKAAFDVDGKLAGEIDLRTKVEKGPDYGMASVSGIGKEIDAQYAALTDWMVGKTLDEIKAIELTEEGVPTSEDLTASVTVKVKDYIAAVEKAVAAAK